jgi:hypothetical protein
MINLSNPSEAYVELSKHVHHALDCIELDGGRSVAIECVECDVVLVDFNKEGSDEPVN